MAHCASAMRLRKCAAAILYRDGRVLLGKRQSDRDFYPDLWDVFGGHCEGDELPEDTLLRELNEELGIIPTGFTLLTVLDDPEPQKHGEYEYHLYLVTEWDGIPSNRSNSEHSEIAWFAIPAAMELDLAHPSYPSIFGSIA